MKWIARRKYYPASRYAGTEEERRAQFRGTRGGLYDIKFVKVKEAQDEQQGNV